jgi:predicted transcriptional regulator
MKEDILGLGPTETEIMSCLWVHGLLTVRQIHAKINAYRLIAYTTILTTSARLEEKGLITRHTTGATCNGARADADGYPCRTPDPRRTGGLS